jgi:hypothetical protein
MNRIFHLLVFLAGLAVVCWIGAGYIGSNPLALGVTTLIAAFYLAAARELYRYDRATAALIRAVADLTETPSSLAAWLNRLHPGLRDAVRLRIEGERVALPGPALTPYVTGLLVLLGMLGTFLGMVATLRGTGVALESATDLQAIRDSLAAPVKGLGFAFGTSVAGVASSAMLGLLSALCRRERIAAAQGLDARIGTTLRGYSRGHQREEAFRLMQRQAEMMPALVDRLQAMMTAMEERNQAVNEQLAAGMKAMERNQQDLGERLTAGHASMAAQLAAGHETLSTRLAAEHQSMSERLTTGHGSLTEQIIARHLELGERLAAGQQAFHDKAEAVYAHLATSVDRSLKESAAESARLASAAFQPVIEAAMAGLARESAALHESVAQAVQRQLDGLSTRFEDSAAGIADIWSKALASHQRASEALAQELRTSLDSHADAFGQRTATLADGIAARLESITGRISLAWTDALSRHQDASAQLAQNNQSAMAGAAAAFEQHCASLLRDVARHASSLLQEFRQHSASLLQTVDQAHAGLRTELAASDERRLDAWSGTLGAIAADLRQEWRQGGEQMADRQREICETLARTAEDITSQMQAHARDTIAEIEHLVQAAAQAPKAAAEVVAELRQKLSDSMARDNAMLDERARLLDTLGTLLDAVNRASTEQREAVDALVSTSAELLDRVGSRFTDRLESETGKLAEAAGQVTASVVEVASLGDAFGAAVRSFGESNDKLMAHLERIDAALEKSITRSDEQLAYYVAQAREAIDLSVLSQKQIIEDLQQLADRRAAAGTEAA